MFFLISGMEAKVKCNRCSKEVSLNYLRYDKNGKDLICFDCYIKQHPEAKNKSFQEVHKVDIKPKKKVPYETTTYVCNDCSYKFELKKGTTVTKRCPYCSSGRIEKYVPVMADELIN